MELTKNQKIGVTVGVILGLTAIGVVTYFLLRPKKDDKDTDDSVIKEADEDYTPPSVTEINLSTPPVEEPKDVKALSYGRVLNKFTKSPNTKKYKDYFTYTVSPSSFGLKSGQAGDRVRAKFMANSGWRLYYIAKGSKTEKFLTGGNYYKGGTKLVVRNGVNKGLRIEGKSPFNNIVRAVRS